MDSSRRNEWHRLPACVRLPDWPERLATFFESRRALPYEPGVNDCGHFAADAIAAMFGIPVGLGARTFRAALRIAGTFPRIPVAAARRGDLVLVRHDRGLAFAVCAGSRCAAPGDDGIEWLPVLAAGIRAWRI